MVQAPQEEVAVEPAKEEVKVEMEAQEPTEITTDDLKDIEADIERRKRRRQEELNKVYKASQMHPPNEYDIDLTALTNYLDTQKVEMDPLTGGEMLDKYFEVVNNNLEEKKKKRTRNKGKAVTQSR